MADEPILPDYTGACICNVVPSIQYPIPGAPDWVPRAIGEAERTTVLLAIDGLGWDQLQARAHVAPTITGVLAGGPITTVAPSTTSTALTSLVTGAPPGEHGVVGYRMAVEGQVLNVLRWATSDGDARRRLPPSKLRTVEPFGGQRPPVVTRAEFAQTGFTVAHLSDSRFVGYRTLSTLVTEVSRLAHAGEPFIYAYYEGLDKVAHEYGSGEYYDAELRWIDHLVSELLGALPPGTCLALTADHGHLDVGDNMVELNADVRTHVALQSGEGRFRWLHARSGRSKALLEAAEGAHSDTGWILSAEQLIAEGWFGPVVTDAARRRLGDVALIARSPIAYVDPDDSGPYLLIGRHGSATSAEMYVPYLAAIV